MVTAAQIASKGIVIYMVGCEPAIVPFKDWFMAMAHITGGQYVPLASATMLSSVSGLIYAGSKSVYSSIEIFPLISSL
jgi:hypothetical protein